LAESLASFVGTDKGILKIGSTTGINLRHPVWELMPLKVERFSIIKYSTFKPVFLCEQSPVNVVDEICVGRGRKYAAGRR
jgi:hypothetical protein